MESIAPNPDALSELTPKQAAFVAEYLVDLSATKAAIRAGYSEHSAHAIGYENLSKPAIQDAIAAAMAARMERTGITADRALQRMSEIAFADVRELVEYRRTSCRFCYGANFGYQFTAHELAKREADARLEWQKHPARKADDVFTFDALGGDGYDKRRRPNPECPVCFGEGVEDVFVHDTRELSPAAVALYAGVKRTKDGIEVKVEDRQAALVNLFKHFSMFVERQELSGPNGAPIAFQVTHTIVDPTPDADAG